VNLNTSGGGGGGPTIITSTITVNQTNSEPPGLDVNSTTGPASIVVNAFTTASISAIGDAATISVQGSQSGSLSVQTSLVGEDANSNKFQVENDPGALTGHTNVVASIDANDNYGAAINLRYISSGVASHQGRFEVYSNETAVSSMVVGLYDADNNPMAELGFNSNGLATNVISAQGLIALNNGLGLGSVYYPGFNNSNSPLDILQAMPLVRVLNASGGDATSSSGLNQFGRMTPGQFVQVIPPTSWSDAAKVVLAPRTEFTFYTSTGGSGGSANYQNFNNTLYSTFTVEPYQTSNVFNSYRMGFG
jgi:hypothetical protein